MVRAAQSGFRLRCTFDNSYLNGESLHLETLLNQGDRELQKSIYLGHLLSMVAAASLKDSSLSERNAAVQTAHTNLIALYRPGLPREDESSWDNMDAAELREMWERAFGSMDSPKVQQDLAAMREIVEGN